MPHLPTPIRAALGLAATAVAEARKLPETLPQLPVAAVSTAMQVSLRVQQHIATFASRGDEVISQLRGTSAEPPSWATFDDSPDARPTAAFDRATAEPANLEDTGSEPGSAEPAHPIDTDTAVSGEPSLPIDHSDDAENAAPAQNGAASAKKAAPAKKAAKALPPDAAKAVPAKTAKKAPAKTAPAKAAPAKAAAKKAPAKKAAKRSEPLVEAARKADPSSGPNPSTMAAEILQAHSGESPADQ